MIESRYAQVTAFLLAICGFLSKSIGTFHCSFVKR